MIKIKECLEGKEGSYIFPFLWLHGEEHDKLSEEIEAVYKSGIKEICFESRTYEDFCGEKWWEDFAFMLDECKKRDMRVWLLDDKHFPTGYANNAIERKYPHLKKKCVRVECLDVAGPITEAAFISDRYDNNTEELVSVSAFKRTGNNEDTDGSTGVVLTGKVKNGLVYWDVPEGIWRIFFVIRTQRGPIHFKNYIDMCDGESCRVMLTEIYEPHYKRFSEYFGNTFRGFFSDEPCFANNLGSYYDSLGNPDLIIPWRNDMIEILAAKANISVNEAEKLLPSLWYTITGKTSLMRYSYMEIITCLYRDNFSRMLGDWCKERGVLYIGHVIEDMNTHMRTGYGSGHYFRALEGQDMSGMDVVLHQILPGITSMPNKSTTSRGIADPGFYINTLPKLCASCAHLDPKKKNRAMVELYGAYGFAEGLPTMKYITDLLLVGGMNHFVPHAFTPKENDPDCPPHFYAGGKNPQYPMFGKLMEYLQKASHVLYGGIHKANAAVFYNAEGEWTGGKNRLFQDVATNLITHQIDFDIVPTDILSEASIKNNRLVINKEQFDALIISYSEVLPERLLRLCSTFAKEGLPVIFTDAYPDRTEENWETKEELQSIQNKTKAFVRNCIYMPTDGIASFFREKGFFDIELQDPNHDVRAYHTSEDDAEIYFFFNLSVGKDVDTYIHFSGKSYKNYYEYDIWNNKVYKCNVSEKGVRLVLTKGQSALIFSCDEEHTNATAKEYNKVYEQPDNILFNVYLKEDKEFSYYCQMNSYNLKNLAFTHPNFCGTVRYEGKLISEKNIKCIDLGVVGEIAKVWVNGIMCGQNICSPYTFDVSKALCTGENTLVIEVVNNPGYLKRDFFSRLMPLPPTGLIGPIRVVC